MEREQALTRIRELRGELPTPAQNVAVRRAVWRACKILRAEGRSINLIAKLLGLSWGTVRKFVAASEPPAGGRLWTRAPTDGLSYQQIGSRLGCDPRTAARWLQSDRPPRAKGRPVRFTAPRDDAA